MISKYYTIDGETLRVFLPDDWKYNQSRSATILSFGMGDDPNYIITTKKLWDLAEEITDNENALIVGTWGGFLFGNQEAQDYLNAAQDIADILGVKPGGIVAVGFSMGATNVLNYAARNSDQVYGVVGIGGLTDLNLVPVDFPPLVAAYPGGYSDVVYGNYNPEIQADNEEYEGMPIQLFWGTQDTQIPRVALQRFQEAVNDQVTISEVNEMEHGWDSVMHPDVVCGILNMLNDSDEYE